MSPEEKSHLSAQNRLIQAMAAKLEGLMDQGLRRDMLELAGRVVSKDRSVSQMEKFLAATLLADLVLKSIPAPRPVAVPVVTPLEENEAC